MKKILSSLIIIIALTGCASTHNDVLGTSQSQVQMRNYQSRSFDTNDKSLVLRAVISTMQDLGFIIERADEKLGTISGTSFSHIHASKLTVSIRAINDKQIVVRANGQVGLKALDNPIPYQNFFNALGQSLFLEAHEVE
ncbi:MAG: hypothetical protein IJ019_04165 [Alphaproteobacteria bacterium]|nr:hypothetical protein [Alphaproteobacteria bacterium]